MKLEIAHEPAPGRLTVTMAENGHADSRPLIDILHFNRFHEKISPETAALAGAIIGSRWCGDLLELTGLRISVDFGEAIRLLAPNAKFIQPIDGYRRQLCEGRLDLLIAPPELVATVLSIEQEEGGLTRLATWGGEFVDPRDRNSRRYVAGDISTNANLLLPDWQVSVCLGLLIGGLELRSITVSRPERKHMRDFERTAAALRIVGVQLRAAEAPTRLTAPMQFRKVPIPAVNGEANLPIEIRI